VRSSCAHDVALSLEAGGFAAYRTCWPPLLTQSRVFRHPRFVLERQRTLPEQEIVNRMIARPTLSRTFATLGCIVLLASAAMHCIAYQKFSAPAVHASNLPVALQSVFEVAFLSMAWSWIVLALLVLVVTFREARLGKTIALICGFAVLIQAVFTLPLVGLFIGNEMIGAASLLIIIGGLLSQGSPITASRPPLVNSR